MGIMYGIIGVAVVATLIVAIKNANDIEKLKRFVGYCDISLLLKHQEGEKSWQVL